MKRAGLLLTFAVLTGCGAELETPQPSGPDVRQAATGSPNSTIASVHFPKYLPPNRGGPEAFMEAGMGGDLAVRGRCLGLAGSGASGFQTVIWPAGAELGQDGVGLFVASAGDRFRLGERLSGGGGTLPSDFSDTVLARPFPAECDLGEAIQFHSFKRATEMPNLPLVSPPPPPTQD